MSLNLSDVLFFVQFLAIIFILGFKLLNLFSLGKIYDLRLSFLLFIGFFISYFVGLMVLLTRSSILLYSALFKLETGFILFNVIFLLGELYFYTIGRSIVREAYKPNREQNK